MNKHVAIELFGDGPEIESIELVDHHPGTYSGISGLVFVGATFREAKQMAVGYAKDERDRWRDAIQNLRDLRAKDVRK